MRNTNIECFNEWVKELKETIIFIITQECGLQVSGFTLAIRCRIFMQHLYDGDAASNTLGWRWVAGVQTRGKHYLASEWNIKKFTNNRFNNIKLNENHHQKFLKKHTQL